MKREKKILGPFIDCKESLFLYITPDQGYYLLLR